MPLIVSDDFPDDVPEWRVMEVLLHWGWMNTNSQAVGPFQDKVLRTRCYGALAVHPCLRQGKEWKNRWTVSSVTTGWKIANFESWEAANGFAEVLWLFPECAAALRCLEVRAVQRRMPRWVMWWARACDEALTFVDPKPFQDREDAMEPCLGRHETRLTIGEKHAADSASNRS